MTDNAVQEIKDRLNIVDVIGGYLQLKKAGVNFRGLCPFHNERTPSFNVSPQRQIWHCFGCGEGGDLFSFVMRYENVDFKQALEILASKAGVELPRYRPKDPKEQEEKELLYRINDYAARLYHQVLTKEAGGKAALGYLAGRGLLLETVKKWQIGFAPDEFHFLHHALLKKDIRETNMAAAGVCVKGDKGQIYDRFRGRITFPIFDYFGKVVGFSARILPKLDDGKSAKYINSPETLIYQKSKILFGLNFAKDEIRKQNEAIIVEGQMDAIASSQAGVRNVVASSGTALTLDQVNLLGRLTKNLKFSFDADQAGSIAQKRAVENVLGTELTVKAIILKDAKDPDELIKKDAQLWRAAILEAPLFLDFYLKKVFENFRGTVEEKKQIAQEVLPLIARLTDPIEKEHYVLLLARQLGTNEKALNQSLEKIGKPKVLPKTPALPATLVSHAQFVNPLEKEVLGGVLTNEKFKEKIRPDLEAADFENEEIRQTVLSIVSQNTEFNKESAIAKEAIFMVESLQAQLEPEALLKRLFKSYTELKVSNIKKKQKVLQNEIVRAERLEDKDLLRKLQEDFAQVSKLKVEWEKR